MFSPESTLRRGLTRILWSRWQFEIMDFILKRLFELSGGVTAPVQILRVVARNMPRPEFDGIIIWVGGYDEPLNMGADDIHLAEVL